MGSGERPLAFERRVLTMPQFRCTSSHGTDWESVMVDTAQM